MNEYALIKLFHLGAFVFWLGPPLGTWLVLKSVDDGTYQPGSIVEKVSKVFYLSILLEHIAFIVLIVSGFMLAYTYDLFGAEWLTQKLYVVLLIILPLEIVDVCLGNWVATRASKKLFAGKALKKWEQRGLEIYHGLFTKVALMIIPTSVSIVMYLAISKIGL